ncbi:transcriptional regulator [Archaeoglobales archaeon]|nr:MAG: transcriptional regulator [Archaeoglobales archaeon]
MKPPCTVVVKYILPAIRAKVARELIEKRGYRVKEASELLGLTQAAISQYLSSKRGQKGMELIEKSEKVMSVIMELVDGVVNGKITVDDEADYLCRICDALKEDNLLDLIINK